MVYRHFGGNTVTAQDAFPGRALAHEMSPIRFFVEEIAQPVDLVPLPVVSVDGLALGSPASTAVEVTYSVTAASVELDEVWLHVATSAPASSAVIRAEGTRKVTGEANFATHSFTGLVYSTLYHVSVMVVDVEGQEVIA